MVDHLANIDKALDPIPNHKEKESMWGRKE